MFALIRWTPSDGVGISNRESPNQPEMWMVFLCFLVLLGIAYLVWRVTDQMPDLIFRLSEVQRDVAEIRRRLTEESDAAAGSDQGGGDAEA
jgi:hypothetical protein